MSFRVNRVSRDVQALVEFGIIRYDTDSPAKAPQLTQEAAGAVLHRTTPVLFADHGLQSPLMDIPQDCGDPSGRVGDIPFRRFLIGPAHNIPKRHRINPLGHMV